MELTFFKSNTKSWVAEFEVTSDFNLHIEKAERGELRVYQKTAGNKYAEINTPSDLVDNKVVDCDFSGSVYPKRIKIVSEIEPTYAEVTARS